MKNVQTEKQCLGIAMVFMVAGEGIEPPTSRLWAWQATSALPRDKYCYLE